MLVTLNDVLKDAQKKQYAVGLFNTTDSDMLDAAIEAFKKRLDSLFEDQALDIETDIKVMNTMLAREGLSGNKDFEITTERTQTT